MNVFTQNTIATTPVGDIFTEIVRIIRAGYEDGYIVKTSNGYVRIRRTLFHLVCDATDYPELNKYINKHLQLSGKRNKCHRFTTLPNTRLIGIGSAHTLITGREDVPIEFHVANHYNWPELKPDVIMVMVHNNLERWSDREISKTSGIITLDSKGIIDVGGDNLNHDSNGVNDVRGNNLNHDLNCNSMTVRIAKIKLTHPDCPVVIKINKPRPRFIMEYPYYIMYLDNYKMRVDLCKTAHYVDRSHYQPKLLINKEWECYLCQIPLQQYYYWLPKRDKACCPICFHYDYYGCQYNETYQIACNPDVQVGYVGHPDGPPTPYVWRDPELERIFNILIQHTERPKKTKKIIMVPDCSGKNIAVLIRLGDFYQEKVKAPPGTKLSAIIVFDH